MYKIEALLKEIAKDGYDDYGQMDTEMLIMELDRVADMFDNFEFHNHNLVDTDDQGWFMLRDLLIAAADRLEND